MSTAARLPATETTTIRARTRPRRSGRTAPRPARAAKASSPDSIRSGRDQVEEHHADGDVHDRDDRHAQQQGPRHGAAGVADLAGDLADVPPARERDEGRDQCRRSGPRRAAGSPAAAHQNGTRFDQSPRPEAKPQSTRKPSRPSFSAASARRTPEPIAHAHACSPPASTAIAATATAFRPQAESGTR